MPSITDPIVHPLPAGAIVNIKLGDIVASPFNPRKDFDAAGIAELAESIKAQGLLENLQRQDLRPLEEAEAFALLQKQDPKKWTPQAIAAAVGKTDRFVQQRIAIATNLSAPLKKKFAEGELSVEAARTLAPLPIAIQNEIPEWAIERGDATQIRQQAFERCIPETAARFDAALYTGAWIEGDAKATGKGRRYFADAALFMKLQTVAAEKTLAEVRKEWPAAKLVSVGDAAKLHWADQQYAYGYGSAAHDKRDGDVPRKFLVPREKCVAIVWIAANGEIRKALGVCSGAAITAAANKRQQSAGADSRMKSPAGEPKDHKAARVAFNAALARAAAKDAAFPDRLFIYRAVDDAFDMTYATVNRILPPAVTKARPGYNDPTGDIKLWQEIAKLTPAQARTACRELLLADMPSWEDFDWKQKPQLEVAIARSLGVTPPAIALPEPPKVEAKVKAAPKAGSKATARAKAVKKKKGAR